MTNKDTRNYLESIRYTKTWKNRIGMLFPIVSVVVIIGVFWWLKLTGITMAGEAFCGLDEHTHDESCFTVTQTELGQTDNLLTCEKEEHIHLPSCYSDIKADLESAEDWEGTLPFMHEEMSLPERITAIARSQLGYVESERNFIVDASGVRHGYTRYGEWYGNPYGEWSGMFVSFCLRYAGLDEIPISAGAETMRIAWEKAGVYQNASDYTPIAGDVVFLDTNENGSADAAAIVVQSDLGTVAVIEGDSDHTVKQNVYPLRDSRIMGYGLPSPENSLIVVESPAAETDAAIETEPVLETESAEPPLMFAASPYALTKIATTVDFSHGMLTESSGFVLYVQSNWNYYAIDGNANAVPIEIDSSGNITADVADPSTLYWTFTTCGTYDNQPSYYIQNVSTGMYLHPYSDGGGSGPILSGRWESAVYSQSSGGVKFRGARQNQYARYNAQTSSFQVIGTYGDGSTFYFGQAPMQCAVWLDGTNGGLKSCAGSPNQRYLVEQGGTIRLPTEWQSPSKYGYALRGWYDVTNSVYYPPGTEITVNGNMVLYADWVAATYDLGRYNAAASNTVSTSHIITTHMFDYNGLFNVMSQNADITVNASGHTETWNHVGSGTVDYQNTETLDFVFVDNDENGRIMMGSGRNENNRYDAGVQVKPGIYNEALGYVLFGTDNGFDAATGEGIIGKTYLGTGDYLFQYMDDPASEYYGYYYYDSDLHAASYNQSEQRFYVYDYLSRTTDSAGASGTEKYSDFLPLNSPYANTNGNNTNSYTYEGANGQYAGVPHYEFDVGHNQTDVVSTNMAFGMSVEMKFYIPDVPGTVDENGEYGNQDLYGNDMIYSFSGDDDVWVLVDGEVVLDIGGIHGISGGEINFSTGIVTVGGQQNNTIYHLAAGDHIMTVYYLERGSSQSNCAMYFNLAPRYSLTVQKEDVLTQELLDGAEFSVYMDPECEEPAALWESKTDYETGKPSTNIFTVKDGYANMWGMSPGKTYYIKETKPPDNAGYDRARGIIRFVFDIKGTATFDIEIMEEEAGEGISGGYTVHGYHINTETQMAYLTVTNAQSWVEEITTVQIVKQWEDAIDHSADYVTVYLTVTDSDGTVRRIREAVLGEENGWTYTWTNLPKYGADGVTEIAYGAEESYSPGYSSTVERVNKIVIENHLWVEAYTFVDGETYLLKTSNGYLSASNSSSQTLTWLDEDTAREAYNDEHSLCAWTATVSGTNVKLTNRNGQILSFNNSSNNRYFFVTKSGTSYQNLVFSDAGSGLKLHYRWSSWFLYYFGALNGSGYGSSVNSNSGLIFTPMLLKTETEEIEVSDIAYTITNIPLEAETSLRVTKYWDTGLAVNVPYETAQVTIRLYANGKDTGRSVTLNLKNNWTATFMGLPYQDEDGSVIVYSVEEVWSNDDWDPLYGEVIASADTIPSYQTTVTNVYKYGHGYELPSTGGWGSEIWVLSGLVLMTISLVSGYILHFKAGRRDPK